MCATKNAYCQDGAKCTQMQKIISLYSYKFCANLPNTFCEICRTCYYHIHDMQRIHWYLLVSIAKTIATVLVSSRLGCCNSLFHDIAIKDITKLRVQNCLARVVTRSPCFTHSKPLLKSLH